jgi:hypothetical protein
MWSLLLVLELPASHGGGSGRRDAVLLVGDHERRGVVWSDTIEVARAGGGGDAALFPTIFCRRTRTPDGACRRRVEAAASGLRRPEISSIGLGSPRGGAGRARATRRVHHFLFTRAKR